MRKSIYMPYDEAKKIVNKLGLRTIPQYRQYIKGRSLELLLPSNPDRHYNIHKSWLSWSDFFGVTYNDIKKYISYDELKKLFIQHNIYDFDELNKFIVNYCKLNNISIPDDIEEYYSDVFTTWDDLFVKKIENNDDEYITNKLKDIIPQLDDIISKINLIKEEIKLK
jgi:hypothetical protein